MYSKFLLLLATSLFFSGGGGKKAFISPPQYSPEISDTIKQTSAEPQSLKLIFAGDIMSQMPQIRSAETGYGQHDYTACFQYIRPVLDKADLAIGNLECTLSYTPPFSGYPHFISPHNLAKSLKINGFDVLVTANNHAVDNGTYGIETTIDILKDQGFIQTGTFKNSKDKDLFYPLIIYKNGFKIALVNYTHHTNGFSVTPPNIVNRLEMPTIKKDIEAAKKMKPDVIIAFLHWGIEHIMVENENQRAIAKQLHQWGANIIIGSHPHVVQPVKMERLNKTDKYLVAYSLGNFISAQPFPNTEGGILLEVDIEKNANKTTISDYHYIPVLRYTPTERGKLQFYALPVSPYQGNEEVLKMPWLEKVKMDAFAKRVRGQLDVHGAKERIFELKDIVQ
jgi:poly-gamma-glutamate capsule biosynthesis protein CapA/YwtB (metallophosphatase superfamily)